LSNVSIRQGKINLELSDGQIWVGKDATQIMLDARGRLLNEDYLTARVKESQLKQLRKQFPGESDEKIIKRVQEQIQVSRNAIGTKSYVPSGGRRVERYPYLDDLRDRLRGRDEDALTSEHQPEQAAVEPVKPKAAARAEGPNNALEIEASLDDLKEYWADLGLGKASQANRQDVLTVLDMVMSDKSKAGGWSADQIAWFQQLRAAYAGNDKQATVLLENIFG